MTAQRYLSDAQFHLENAQRSLNMASGLVRTEQEYQEVETAVRGIVKLKEWAGRMWNRQADGNRPVQEGADASA
jgi:hypothetical protein